MITTTTSVEEYTLKKYPSDFKTKALCELLKSRKVDFEPPFSTAYRETVLKINVFIWATLISISPCLFSDGANRYATIDHSGDWNETTTNNFTILRHNDVWVPDLAQGALETATLLPFALALPLACLIYELVNVKIFDVSSRNHVKRSNKPIDDLLAELDVVRRFNVPFSETLWPKIVSQLSETELKKLNFLELRALYTHSPDQFKLMLKSDSFDKSLSNDWERLLRFREASIKSMIVAFEKESMIPFLKRPHIIETFLALLPDDFWEKSDAKCLSLSKAISLHHPYLYELKDEDCLQLLRSCTEQDLYLEERIAAHKKESYYAEVKNLNRTTFLCDAGSGKWRKCRVNQSLLAENAAFFNNNMIFINNEDVIRLKYISYSAFNNFIYFLEHKELNKNSWEYADLDSYFYLAKFIDADSYRNALIDCLIENLPLTGKEQNLEATVIDVENEYTIVSQKTYLQIPELLKLCKDYEITKLCKKMDNYFYDVYSNMPHEPRLTPKCVDDYISAVHHNLTKTYTYLLKKMEVYFSDMASDENEIFSYAVLEVYSECRKLWPEVWNVASKALEKNVSFFMVLWNEASNNISLRKELSDFVLGDENFYIAIKNAYNPTKKFAIEIEESCSDTSSS